MDEPKLFVDENQVPPVRVQREGSSAYGLIRTLLDPETAGAVNAVLGVMTVPSGQPEPMQPHAHFESDESEHVVSGGGHLLMGRSQGEPERHEFKPGCALFVPACYPYRVVNTGPEEFEIVFSFSLPGLWVEHTGRLPPI